MEQKNGMLDTEKLIAMAPEEFLPDYYDDDLIIIDNVKLLAGNLPIRPNMNIIAICTKGRLQANMNGTFMEVKTNCTFLCPPNITLDNMMISPDFEYMAMGITNQALQAYLQSRMEIWNRAIYVDKVNVIEMSDIDMLFYEKYYELVRLCLDSADDKRSSIYPYKREVMHSFVRSGLLGLCNVLVQQCGKGSGTMLQSTTIFNQFLDMLQRTKVKHQSVDYYAGELCITPKYLTVICKKNSEKTANEWITEYTMADITYYLCNTSLSIKEISNKTGFSSNSFFGKYVKEHFGVSPKQYRDTQK